MEAVPASPESPSMAKGVRLRLLSLRGSWVQIPPPAPFNNIWDVQNLVIHEASSNVLGYLLPFLCFFGVFLCIFHHQACNTCFCDSICLTTSPYQKSILLN